jgi:hypothetical protein
VKCIDITVVKLNKALVTWRYGACSNSVERNKYGYNSNTDGSTYWGYKQKCCQQVGEYDMVMNIENRGYGRYKGWIEIDGRQYCKADSGVQKLQPCTETVKWRRGKIGFCTFYPLSYVVIFV